MSRLNKIEISVIIPTYNRREQLRKCLISLFAQTFPNDKYEVIIVDDGSNDGTLEMIDELKTRVKGNIRYLWQEHKGAARARNFGIKSASGEIIGFTDSDVIPQSDWLEKAIKYFRKDEKIIGIEGKTIVPNPERITPFTHQVENLKGGNFMTCNIFYRKEALDIIGGFDERFELAIREDSDLAFSVLKKGWKIHFAPDVVVKHPVSKIVDYWIHFKSARYGLYEALLFKKHPKLYKKKLKWLNGRAFPVYYYGYYLSCICFFFMNFKFAIILGIFLFLFSHIFTLYALCRKKKVNIKDFIILTLQFLIVPFVRLYWVMSGNWKYKSFVC